MIRWNEHVSIAGQRNQVYRLDDFKPPKDKRKIRCPNYTPGSSMTKEDAEKMIRFITFKLDFELLAEVLDDKKFYKKYLTLVHLEIIVGKGLISGELENVKKLMEKARGIEKFCELQVTDAYFDDMIVRKKKSLKKKVNLEREEGIILITVVRQGDPETLKFVLANLGEDVKLQTAYVNDGDMAFSVWARTREVVELSAEEKLLEAGPKVKVFDSQFEAENALTCVLKNVDAKNKSGSSQKMLELLLENSADPIENRFNAFKIAARYGLRAEIEMMLKHMNKVNKRTLPKFWDDISIAILGNAASENQQDVIDYIKNKLKPKASKHKSGRATTAAPKENRYPKYVQKAAVRLMEYGRVSACTYRYRLLNGVFNLLSIKVNIEEEESRKAALASGDVLAPTKGADISLQRNNWKRVNGSMLRVNDTVNYNAAFVALSNKKAKGLGAKLNANLKMNMNAGGDPGDGASVRSSRTYSTTSSSNNMRSKKSTLIKPNSMLQWMSNVLSNNDFNGEHMGMVLLALGLRFYISTPRKKRRKSGASEAESTWGMESVASGVESEAEDDPRKGEDGESESDDEKMFPNPRRGKAASARPSRRRRKSTLSNVMEMFKGVGQEIGNKIGGSKKMSSKSKVMLLEMAAEFGSQQIMHELLELIAPDVSKSLLKCLYLATIGDKASTHKVLMDKVTREYEALTREDNKKAPKLGATKGVHGSNRSMRVERKAKANGKSDFIQAVEDFFVIYEAEGRLQRNKEHKNKNEKRILLGKSNNDGNVVARVARKSITAARRSSQKVADAFKGLISGKNKKQTKIDLSMGKSKGGTMSKLRKSMSEKMGKKKPTQADKIKAQLKQKQKKGNKYNGDPASTALRNMEKNRKTGSPKDLEQEDDISSAYSRFLIHILELACRYGHLSIAEYTLDSPYINKEQGRVKVQGVLVQLNRKITKDMVNERVLGGLVGLLADHLPKEIVDIPDVARGVLDAGTQNENPNVKSLRFTIRQLTIANKKCFLTLADVLFVVNKSTKENTEWKLWPKVIQLVYDHLATEEKQKFETINTMIKKHKPKLKLSSQVERAISDILNRNDTSMDFFDDDGGKTRRRSSMSRIFTRGAGKVRRSLSGSFSKTKKH